MRSRKRRRRSLSFLLVGGSSNCFLILRLDLQQQVSSHHLFSWAQSNEGFVWTLSCIVEPQTQRERERGVAGRLRLREICDSLLTIIAAISCNKGHTNEAWGWLQFLVANKGHTDVHQDVWQSSHFWFIRLLYTTLIMKLLVRFCLLLLHIITEDKRGQGICNSAAHLLSSAANCCLSACRCNWALETISGPAFSGLPQSNGGWGSYSILSCTVLAVVSSNIKATSWRAMSIPADTPAAVMILPFQHMVTHKQGYVKSFWSSAIQRISSLSYHYSICFLVRYVSWWDTKLKWWRFLHFHIIPASVFSEIAHWNGRELFTFLLLQHLFLVRFNIEMAEKEMLMNAMWGILFMIFLLPVEQLWPLQA